MDNKAFFKIPYGLFIISSKDNTKQTGCVTNTLMQVSSSPATVAISINKSNFTHDVVASTRKFNASILNTNTDFDFIKNFGFQSGKTVNKFDSNAPLASNGIAYVDTVANAYICCEVKNIYDFGTHSVFEGVVTDSVILNDTPSVTYDYYQKNIKPRAQTTAPSTTIWRCDICGYEYHGDNLPTDFVCPLCKHGASDFSKVTQ